MFTKETIKKVSLELTKYCNLNCPACDRKLPNATKTINKHLNLNKILNVIDSLHLDTLEIIGGISEPTLYPQLPQLVKEAKKRNIKVLISSNFSIKNNPYWLELAEALTSEDVILCCIDGHTQELHERYRSGSDLNTVINNIKLLRTYSNVTIRGLNLLFQHNKNYWKEIKEFTLEHCHEWEPRIGNTQDINTVESVSKWTVPKNVMKIVELKSKQNNKQYTTKCECPDKNFSDIYVTVSGDVYPCCLYTNLTHQTHPNQYTQPLDNILENLNTIFNNRNQEPICLSSCNKQLIIIEDTYNRKFYKELDFHWEDITNL